MGLIEKKNYQNIVCLLFAFGL